MENFESAKSPEVEALKRAQQVIEMNGLDLSVAIEERDIRLTGEQTWSPATVFHFQSPTNPTVEWTMDINTDPSYLESDLPDVIVRSYQERVARSA